MDIETKKGFETVIRYRLEDLDEWLSSYLVDPAARKPRPLYAETLEGVALTETQWRRVRSTLFVEGVQSVENARSCVEAVLSAAQNGLTVDDWQMTNFRSTIRHWSHKGIWTKIFAALQDDPSFKFVLSWSASIMPKCDNYTRKKAKGIEIIRGIYRVGPSRSDLGAERRERRKNNAYILETSLKNENI
jgi:transposase